MISEKSKTKIFQTEGGACGQDSSGGGGGKKPRKARTIFTDKQLQALEDSFDRQKYLSVQDRMELANRLQLSDTQVKTWYQNRRLVMAHGDERYRCCRSS